MCFGARGNQFGKFSIPLRGGSVGAIKLVYGTDTCPVTLNILFTGLTGAVPTMRALNRGFLLP